MKHLKKLPHNIPAWVIPSQETYFITIVCRDRGGNQLATREVSEKLFETVRYRQEQHVWWPHLVLLMPDHLHGLFSFPPYGMAFNKIISKWKEWTAKSIRLNWQNDFFEHRLRREESRRNKADYILQNPVRKGLVTHAEDWPYIYFGEGKRPNFES